MGEGVMGCWRENGEVGEGVEGVGGEGKGCGREGWWEKRSERVGEGGRGEGGGRGEEIGGRGEGGGGVEGDGCWEGGGKCGEKEGKKEEIPPRTEVPAYEYRPGNSVFWAPKKCPTGQSCILR